jgi:peptidoglycan/xylan/chitin deacetylase (PgdA/CDA1 family)
MPNSTICLSFDFDALSVWFSYPHTTPAMLARGEYGARVGVPRILELLARYQLPATFFIPGHTVESFPAVVERILAAGHEVGHHSYAHVNPSQQTPDEERRDMERALGALQAVGVKPLGFRSPSADYSDVTLALIEEYGFRYDSSLMADDFRPYHPRAGDRVSQQSPLVPGRESSVWELPICFEFDDWVHFQFNFEPYRNGTSAPSKVLEIWQADVDWMHRHVTDGILTAAMHPQVIGRAHRVAMLEQFILFCQARGDLEFSRMGDVVARL